MEFILAAKARNGLFVVDLPQIASGFDAYDRAAAEKSMHSAGNVLGRPHRTKLICAADYTRLLRIHILRIDHILGDSAKKEFRKMLMPVDTTSVSVVGCNDTVDAVGTP
jgi:hypothetical protein